MNVFLASLAIIRYVCTTSMHKHITAEQNTVGLVTASGFCHWGLAIHPQQTFARDGEIWVKPCVCAVARVLPWLLFSSKPAGI